MQPGLRLRTFRYTSEDTTKDTNRHHPIFLRVHRPRKCTALTHRQCDSECAAPPMPRPPNDPRHAPQPSCPLPDPLASPRTALSSFHPHHPRESTRSRHSMTGVTARAPRAGATSHVAGRRRARYTRSAARSIVASRTAWAR
jgi:hypothetical protein